MTQIHTLADQFAQALANGELSITDLGTVLEHVNGYLSDYHKNAQLWVSTDFDEVAIELYKAEIFAKGDEE